MAPHHEPDKLSPEDLYRLLAENASDIVYQTDGLDIIWISPSVTDLLGWKPDELIGQPAAHLVSPHQDLTFIRRNRELLDRGETVYQEMLLVGTRGEQRWFAGRARPMPGEAGAAGFMVGMHDIHDQMLARKALVQSERMYRSAIEHAGVGVWLLAPDERTLEVNESLCLFLGYSPEEMANKDWHEITHFGDVPIEEEFLRQIHRGERDSFRVSKRYLHADGTVVFGDLTVAAARDDEGHVLLITKQVIDVTEQTLARDRLTRLATTDPMTSLPNRASILTALEKALTSRVRDPQKSGEKQHVGVLFVDLDNFKLVNESLGHAAGDSLLTAVAERLRDSLSRDVPVGRFGGDEFLVVVPAPADEATIETMAHRIFSALAAEFRIHGRKVVMTASVGAALSQPESTPATLLQDADVALSEAKRNGKSRWRVFNLGMASAAIRRLVLEGDLRDAIERREFTSHYMPVHRLADGSRSGFEALIRWQHPTEGLLLPAAFLGVAEESGLIVPIGEQALRAVCRDMVANPRITDKFAVNISAVQLSEPGWLESFLSILDEEQVPASRMVIELTETAVMSTRHDLARDLERLGDLGVGIHVDDFGTGYSSISLLRDLPISGLKLDGSFVAMLNDETASGYALAEGLARLAHSIGLQGIAEGVETQIQAAYLRAMGWSHAQGWLYGKAAPLDEWEHSKH